MIKVYESAEVGLGLEDVVAAVALVFILVIVNSVAHFVSYVSGCLCEMCKHPTLGMMFCKIDKYPVGVVQSELAWNAIEAKEGFPCQDLGGVRASP